MNYKEKTKRIAFDLDKTLYPNSPEVDREIQIQIYQKIGQYLRCSISMAENLFLRLYEKMSGSKTLINLLNIPKETAREIVQEALEKADLDRFLIPNDDTIVLLKELKNRYLSVDLITGSSKGNALQKISKLGLQDIFDHHITGEEASKSDGDAYQKWLDLYDDSDPDHFLYVGDEKSRDYQSASKFGIPVILVNQIEKDDQLDCLQLSSLLEIKDYLL